MFSFFHVFGLIDVAVAMLTRSMACDSNVIAYDRKYVLFTVNADLMLSNDAQEVHLVVVLNMGDGLDTTVCSSCLDRLLGTTLTDEAEVGVLS